MNKNAERRNYDLLKMMRLYTLFSLPKTLQTFEFQDLDRKMLFCWFVRGFTLFERKGQTYSRLHTRADYEAGEEQEVKK